MGGSLDKLKDHELIEKFLQTQDTSYFNLLYRRYAAKVYSKCISMLKDEARAQDAVQDIFAKLFLNLHKFNKKARLSTWIYAITYNHCIDQIRRHHKDIIQFGDNVEDPDPIAEDVQEVHDKVLLEMELDRLEAVLDAIPPDDKVILLMKYQDGMQIKEIAEALDKTESAVKMKIKRAKAKAHKAYVKLFGDFLR